MQRSPKSQLHPNRTEKYVCVPTWSGGTQNTPNPSMNALTFTIYTLTLVIYPLVVMWLDVVVTHQPDDGAQRRIDAPLLVQREAPLPGWLRGMSRATAHHHERLPSKPGGGRMEQVD